jgi:di/tricarboxylate transporter
MTLEILFLFVVLTVMVVLFLTEKLPVELTAFIGLATLTLTGYLAPDEAFEGFASPAVITMLSIFFISAALLHTGVADSVASRIHALVGGREIPLVILIMLAAGALSAFMNNIAAVAVMMPAVAALARQAKIAPSRLFMPLAFGAILGGTTTLVGTPPNILTAEVMADEGLETFEFFDFTPFGFALLGAGVLYMITVGRWILPDRDPGAALSASSDLTQIYRLRERLFSLRVPHGSPLDGMTLRAAELGAALGVNVVAIERGGDKQLAPRPDAKLQGGDLLLVEGKFSDLEHMLRVQGVEVAESNEVRLREAAGRFSGIRVRIGEESLLAGKTLQELHFRERFGVMVAALWRDGMPLHDRPGGLPLRVGDELLGLGERAEIEELAAHPDIEVLEVGPPAVKAMDDGLMEVTVGKGSPLAGVTLRESRLGELVGLTVVGVSRGGGQLRALGPDELLEEGDELLVTGEPARVLSLMRIAEMEAFREVPEVDLESDEIGVVEAVVAPRSGIAGQTLKELDFRERYGLQVLAVWREGEPIHQGLANISLRIGDALLLQGPTGKIRRLGPDHDFLVLEPTVQEERRSARAPFALLGLGLMVALVVSGLFPIQVAAFTAAVFVVITGALSMEQAYRAIEWRAIFLVAAVLPVGIAMETSGAALLIASSVADVAGALGPQIVLILLLVMSSLLSQGLDGAPTVVLLAPVVFRVAEQLEISPYPLMMGVGLAASAAFMTPFSHKANLLVMGAGGYRVGDFIRVGSILTVVVLGILALMIPLFFPF